MANITMSISFGGGGSYPGHHFTISQLIYAAKMKLHDSSFCGRYVLKPKSSFNVHPGALKPGA